VTEPSKIDGALVQWGERLFYPHNRITKVAPKPRLTGLLAQRAAILRSRIEATVVRRAPQVMVKVTGGGRGMRAIAAHFRYISKNGRLDIEDEQGQVSRGRDAVRELADDWRYGGTLIDDIASPAAAPDELRGHDSDPVFPVCLRPRFDVPGVNLERQRRTGERKAVRAA